MKHTEQERAALLALVRRFNKSVKYYKSDLKVDLRLVSVSGACHAVYMVHNTGSFITVLEDKRQQSAVEIYATEFLSDHLVNASGRERFYYLDTAGGVFKKIQPGRALELINDYRREA